MRARTCTCLTHSTRPGARSGARGSYRSTRCLNASATTRFPIHSHPGHPQIGPYAAPCVTTDAVRDARNQGEHKATLKALVETGSVRSRYARHATLVMLVISSLYLASDVSCVSLLCRLATISICGLTVSAATALHPNHEGIHTCCWLFYGWGLVVYA